MRLPYLICLLFSLVLLPGLVLAQETTPLKDRREAIKAQVETRKEIVADRISDRKVAVASRAAAIKERIVQGREAAQEKREERRVNLTRKLQAFKDKTKATVVDKVDQNLDQVNQNRTTSMTNHLDKMTQLLDKIEDRTASASADVDTSEITTSITIARGKVAAAQDAVAAQAGKEYTVVVSTESSVKADVKASRDSLHTDLKATHNLVVEARQSLAEVVRVIQSTRQENN